MLACKRVGCQRFAYLFAYSRNLHRYLLFVPVTKGSKNHFSLKKIYTFLFTVKKLTNLSVTMFDNIVLVITSRT